MDKYYEYELSEWMKENNPDIEFSPWQMEVIDKIFSMPIASGKTFLIQMLYEFDYLHLSRRCLIQGTRAPVGSGMTRACIKSYVDCGYGVLKGRLLKASL